MTEMKVVPVTLEGTLLRLEPLAVTHHAALCAVGLDEELWRWVPKPVRSPEEMAAYIAFALAEQASGRALPFVIVEKASGQTIGSTRFGAIEPAHRRLQPRLDEGEIAPRQAQARGDADRRGELQERGELKRHVTPRPLPEGEIRECRRRTAS